MPDERTGRTWKRVVPEKDYKRIEAILYGYADMIQEIKDWKESAMFGSRKPDDGMPRGHAHISDPTALATMKMMDPPPRILENMHWIEVVDTTLRKLKALDRESGTNLFDICRIYYHIESLTSRYGRRNPAAVLQEMADKFHTVYRNIAKDKDLIVTHCYTIAVWKGMLSPVDEDTEE